MSQDKPSILYVVYWGAAEPLGQSLVLPAMKKLADLGAQLTLVTFEKPVDLKRADEISRIRELLNESGVHWIPLRYHKHPKVPATAFDFSQGYARSVVSQLGARPDVVHSRTFVGGLMGLAIAPTLRSKLIYHNEGFYPDEQVDAGVWKLDSAPHRFARLLERRLYSRADGVIALSHKAKAIIEKLPAVESKRTPVIVVPSCVDLDHFRWNHRQSISPDVLRLVYVGRVGGRYDLERIGRFAVAALNQGMVNLRILTPSDPNLVRSTLEAAGLPSEAWSMDCVRYGAIPTELASQHAGVHFLPQGVSDHGGSPTKIGEYWAAGLPVVVSPNAGDSDEIIRRERVGVIVEANSDEANRRAAIDLRALLDDSELPLRCRRAAEMHYALGPACERQFSLYEKLTSETAGSSATIGAAGLNKS